ncbi:DUF2550 family protein [Georgenia faecalis]|uniref:DUF2550 family protein n=1 Tax=Georgenia faecalis TaxID=2483799 RepID=A0ABV9DDT1_9MICO|nr:DUF2550 family protein [Georgenia faecalis]
MGWLGVVLLALLLVVVLAGALLLWRARALGRRVGSFECARRIDGAWRSGIASYGAGRLDWHRLVSLSWHPAARWRRRDLVLVGWDQRVRPGGPSHVVEARFACADATFELAMRAEAFAGMTSWLEATPPSERGLVYSED